MGNDKVIICKCGNKDFVFFSDMTVHCNVCKKRYKIVNDQLVELEENKKKTNKKFLHEDI